MKTIQTQYKGNLRTEATHVKSGNTIITDAPTDNHGKGEAFSPTDLLAASLSSCMLTMMGIVAKKHDFPFENAEAKTTKVMADKPRRVKEIIIEIDVPDSSYSEKEQRLLKKAALNCPVAQSLHNELKQVISINFNT